MEKVIEIIKLKRWLIWSFSLAGVVFLFDMEYAKDNYSDNKYLIIFMMVQVHVAYILIPYFKEKEIPLDIKWHEFYRRFTFNKAMRTIFFFGALLPASLQISSFALAKINNEIRTEPEKPEKPAMDEKQLNADIQYEKTSLWVIKHDNSIEKNDADEIISRINNRLVLLQQQKNDYRDLLLKFNKDTLEYPSKIQEYREYQKKQEKGGAFFDYLNLIFPFVIIIALQVMNMQASKKSVNDDRIPESNLDILSKHESQISKIEESLTNTNELVTSIQNTSVLNNKYTAELKEQLKELAGKIDADLEI